MGQDKRAETLPRLWLFLNVWSIQLDGLAPQAGWGLGASSHLKTGTACGLQKMGK